jgi:hypothetical protein
MIFKEFRLYPRKCGVFKEFSPREQHINICALENSLMWR